MVHSATLPEKVFAHADEEPGRRYLNLQFTGIRKQENHGLSTYMEVSQGLTPRTGLATALDIFLILGLR